MTRFAPAFQHCRTISATIFGLVLAACSGVRSQPMFGFTSTTSVRETKRRMPPSSSMAVRASCSGSSPWMTAISGQAASAATVWLRLAFIASACSGRSLCLLSQNPRPAAPAATPPTRSNLISASRRLSIVPSVGGILFCLFAFARQLNSNLVLVPVSMPSVTMPCAKQPTSAAKAALTLIGFSAVIGQIVLMRELIVVFNGNEISLGIMLATWLFWTAVGSGLGSRFVLGGKHARWPVAALECLLGVSLLPTIWALRASRSFFQTVPGELVGPVPMLLTSLACLSLFCLIAGSLFVVATRMYEQECGISARVATSSAYLLEAAGSTLGGILASIVMLRFLGSFQIAIVVVLLNLCMAAALMFPMSRKQLAAVAAGAALFAIPLFIYVAPSL